MHKVVLPDSANGKPSFDCNPTILCVEEDPYFVQGSLAVMPGLEFSFNSQLNRSGQLGNFMAIIVEMPKQATSHKL